MFCLTTPPPLQAACKSEGALTRALHNNIIMSHLSFMLNLTSWVSFCKCRVVESLHNLFHTILLPFYAIAKSGDKESGQKRQLFQGLPSLSVLPVHRWTTTWLGWTNCAMSVSGGGTATTVSLTRQRCASSLAIVILSCCLRFLTRHSSTLGPPLRSLKKGHQQNLFCASLDIHCFPLSI